MVSRLFRFPDSSRWSPLSVTSRRKALDGGFRVPILIGIVNVEIGLRWQHLSRHLRDKISLLHQTHSSAGGRKEKSVIAGREKMQSAALFKARAHMRLATCNPRAKVATVGFHLRLCSLTQWSRWKKKEKNELRWDKCVITLYYPCCSAGSFKFVGDRQRSIWAIVVPRDDQLTAYSYVRPRNV